MRRLHQFMIGRILVWVGVALIMTGTGVSRAAADHGAPVEQLIAALGGAAEPKTRWRAAEHLGRKGIKTENVISALVDALAWDDHSAVRGRAAQALGLLGGGMDGIYEALIEIFDLDNALKVRWRVVEALERIGSANDEVAPMLIKVMRGDKYPGVRARAAEAIGSVCPATGHVVRILTKAYLEDDHPGVRWQAAKALEMCAVNLQNTKTTGVIASLRDAHIALSASREPDIRTNGAAIRRVIQNLERDLSRK